METIFLQSFSDGQITSIDWDISARKSFDLNYVFPKGLDISRQVKNLKRAKKLLSL